MKQDIAITLHDLRESGYYWVKNKGIGVAPAWDVKYVSLCEGMNWKVSLYKDEAYRVMLSTDDLLVGPVRSPVNVVYPLKRVVRTPSPKPTLVKSVPSLVQPVRQVHVPARIVTRLSPPLTKVIRRSSPIRTEVRFG